MSTVRKPRSKPRRVQYRRTAGWRKPANTVYVGRPSKWHNPYKAEAKTREEHARIVALFEKYVRKHPELVAEARVELKGKNLGCWCAPHLPCHAEVWLRLVNR